MILVLWEICLNVIKILIFIFVLKAWSSQRKPSNYPRGPKWLPFVGNLFLLKKLSKLYGGQHLALKKLAEEYQTNVLGLKLGRDYVVAVFSDDVVRKVLTEEEYEGRPDNFFFRLRSMSTRKGVTGTDGEFWRIQRSFISTHLRNVGFGKKPMENFIREEIGEVLEILNNRGAEVKIGALLAPAVINVLWALTSGSTISRSDRRLDSLLRLLNRRSKAFDSTGGTLTQLPFLRFVAPRKTGYSLILDLNNQLKQIVQKVIADHFYDWSEDKSNDDLMYSFITEMKKNLGSDTTFTEDQLIMICHDILIAGSETTSNTLDFAFLMMILHPDVQKKVHQCLEMEFRGAFEINYADRTRVPYIEAVLLEVQRHCHVIPILPRRVMRDTTLEGYRIPKDTTVLISFHSVYTGKDLWNDPEVFRPDRFLDADGELVNQAKQITFGLGRRRCLGDALAKNCIFVFFAEIMRKYDVYLSPGSKIPQGLPLPGITMSPEDYRAQFVERII